MKILATIKNSKGARRSDFCFVNPRIIIKRTLDIESGVEGSSSDLYSYTRYVFKENDREIILHVGLCSGILIDGNPITYEDKILLSIFIEETGLTLEQFEDAYREIRIRRFVDTRIIVKKLKGFLEGGDYE